MQTLLQECFSIPPRCCPYYVRLYQMARLGIPVEKYAAIMVVWLNACENSHEEAKGGEQDEEGFGPCHSRPFFFLSNSDSLCRGKTGCRCVNDEDRGEEGRA